MIPLFKDRANTFLLSTTRADNGLMMVALFDSNITLCLKELGKPPDWSNWPCMALGVLVRTGDVF